MFIAVRIDTNTAETFRHGVWYAKGDEYQRLNIVPFTLAQFKRYFESMFKTKQTEPEKLVQLIDHCSRKRDMMEAPAWKEYIDSAVHNGIYGFDRADNHSSVIMVAEDSALYGVKKKYAFPYGIYFGTKIKDTVKNQIRCVVGIQKNYILVAFEAGLEPRVMPVGEEGFERGYFVVA